MKYFLLLPFFFISDQITAQTEIKKNTISAEFLGHSLNGISINYDRIVKPLTSGWINYTVGSSFAPGNDFNRFSISNSINYTSGKKNGHFEAGLGVGYLTIKRQVSTFIPNYYTQRSASRLVLISRLGYKFQRPQGGFFMRIGLTPNAAILQSDPPCFGFLCELDLIAHWAGLSVGYSF